VQGGLNLRFGTKKRMLRCQGIGGFLALREVHPKVQQERTRPEERMAQLVGKPLYSMGHPIELAEVNQVRLS
jgi:hypothetical protein